MDITEREDPRVVVELAWRDSDQFGRSPTVAQRVIEDAVDAACEGGAPRVVTPGDVTPGDAPSGAAGR